MGSAPAAVTLPLTYPQLLLQRTIDLGGFDPKWQHVALATRLDEPLDVTILQSAITDVVRRRPALRAKLVRVDDATMLQEVHSEVIPPVEQLDFADKDDVAINRALSALADEPLDIGDVGPWRFAVANGPGPRTYILSVVHHRLSDLVGVALLQKDILATYKRLASGDHARAGPESPSWTQHARLEARKSADGTYERLFPFWQSKLEGSVPYLRIPNRRPDPTSRSVAVANGRLPYEATAALLLSARKLGVGAFTLVVAAVDTAIREVFGQDDLLMQAVVDIRGRQFAQTVGHILDLVLLPQAPLGHDHALLHRQSFVQGLMRYVPSYLLLHHISSMQQRAQRGLVQPTEVQINYVPNIFRDFSNMYFLAHRRRWSPGPYLGLVLSLLFEYDSQGLSIILAYEDQLIDGGQADHLVQAILQNAARLARA